MAEQLQTKTQDPTEFDPYGSIFLPTDLDASVEIIEQHFARWDSLLLLRRGQFHDLNPDEQQKKYEELCLVRTWYFGRHVVSMALCEVA